jgi:hypothetical protein
MSSSVTPDVAGFYQVTVGDEYTSRVDVTKSFGVAFDFFRPTLLTTGAANYWPIAGDFDRDGDTDIASLVVLESDITGIALDRSIGSGAYSDETFSLNDVATSNLGSGDLDGDGKDEIAVVTPTGVVLMHPDTMATQRLPIVRTSECNKAYVTLSISDANADGRPDVILVDTCERTVSTWIQSASGTLGAAATQSLPDIGPWIVSVGDVNNDRRADIAVPFASANKVVIFVGAAGGTFTPLWTFLNVPSMSVLIADITGDQRSDLVLADGANVAVIEQLQDGTLGMPQVLAFATDVFNAPLRVGDFDRNGLPDIVSANSHNLVFGLQRSTKVFELVEGPGLPFTSMCPDVIADVNGDSRLDILCARQSGLVDLNVWLQSP